MAHAYKDLFERVNTARKARGLMTLTWKEFISKRNDPLVKTYRQKLNDHIEPDPPKKIVRPVAEYSNKSPYDKYGI